MPRPGPRPYECVRRAWHSERHKPIRGSLIQEIFRVVNESHSSATQRNKEWQVKLPIVVLKAEEIMYSKANSEAEYLDHKTLWDRINDAINTIIRREESSETGDLLQPCIEAALILGCTARRSSRSQRNITPRCYLNPTSQDQNSSVHGGGSSQMPAVLQAGNSTSSTQYLQYHSNISRSTTMNAVPIGLESCCSPVSQDNNNNNNNPTMPPLDFPFSSENLYPSGINQHFPLEHTFAKLGRVFPLIYGARNQSTHPLFDFQSTHQSSNLDNAPLVGKPQVQSIHEPSHFHQPVNLSSTSEGIADTTSRIRQVNLSSTSGASAEIECDLSLRLGPLSSSFASAEARLLDQCGDVGRCSSREVRFCDPSSTKDGGDLYFYHNDNADGNAHRFSSNWCPQNLSLSLGGPNRKRKPSDNTDLIECSHSSTKPKSLTNLFFGRQS